MALKATIFKADLQISDMDRNHYESYPLTLAQHPSETEERMMVRLLAFALHAHEDLSFTKGLSSDDEPELWQKALTGEIDLWIDLGQIDETRIRKACGRAKQVHIYCYNQRSATVWWEKIEPSLDRFTNLSVTFLPDDISKQLAELARRNMSLNCMIQDGQIWLSEGDNTVEITPVNWK